MRHITLIITVITGINVFSQQPEKTFFTHEKTTKEVFLNQAPTMRDDTNRYPKNNRHQDFITKEEMPANTQKQKTHKSVKQCLDSIVAAENWKITYLYDNSGNTILNILYYWNNTNEVWEEEEKRELTYDNKGNLIANNFYNWENKSWKNFRKSLAAYDANENLILEEYYNWDSIKNDWIEDLKREYVYDTNGRLIMSATYLSFDNVKNTWIGSTKNEYAYDTNGREIMSASYHSFDRVKNIWIGFRKDEAAFDANGTQFMRLLWLWDNMLSDWELMYKDTTIFTFDTNGKPIMGYEYLWVGNVWETDYKARKEYAYDTNGNPIMYTRYIWANNAWFGTSKYEYAYDNHGNRISSISYNWINNNWQCYQKSEYVYNNNRNWTLEVFYVWDTIKNDWLGSRKCEITYDNNEKMTLIIYYGWNTAKNDWLGYSKEVAMYDGYSNLTQVVIYGWDNDDWQEIYKSEFLFNHSYSMDETFYPSELYTFYKWLPNNTNIITEAKYYEWKTNDWEQYFSEKFYYSPHKTTSITKPQTTEIRVYPNPTTGQLRITNYELRESTTIEIYNVVGQKLLSIESLKSTETTIDIQHLTNGMYFLKVGNQVVRFVKE